LTLLVILPVLQQAGCSTLPVPGPAGPGASNDAFDHADFDSFLRRHVDSRGRVDYAAAVNDRADLSRYLARIALESPDSMPERFPTEADRLAYWINGYNAWVLQAVLDRYPIASVRDVRPPWVLFFLPRLSGFFVLQKVTLGGEAMSLYALENSLIRVRFHDPRVHFALNCASESCPRLPARAFQAAGLNETLDLEAHRFVADERNARIDPVRGVVHLSSIFDWYKEDFLGFMKRSRPDESASLLGYVSAYLDPEGARALAACGDCRIEFIAYDWALNDHRNRP
jgi:hypothetical protein